MTFVSLPVKLYRELLLSRRRLRRHWRQRGHHTKFYFKVLYVMGKALSGELSCIGTGLIVVSIEFLYEKSKICSVYLGMCFK